MNKIVLIIGLSLLGCPGPAAESIVGSWRESPRDGGTGGASTVTFAADGTYSSTTIIASPIAPSNPNCTQTFVVPGTWSTSGNRLTLRTTPFTPTYSMCPATLPAPTPQPALEIHGTFVLSGNTLTVTADQGETGVTAPPSVLTRI